jgi:5-methylcytosine-specific restriction endonuclease McrA
MTNNWRKITSEQRAEYVARAKAKRHAKALAEGRVPGQIGTPKRTPIEKKRELRRMKQVRLMGDPEKRAKHYAAKNSARRAEWAKKAASEGRPVRKWRYTTEEKEVSNKASSIRYRKKNLEYIRNRDAEIKRKERTTAEGKIKESAIKRKYYEIHKEKIKAANKAWISANKEKRKNVVSVYASNRRARLKDASGTHTADDIRALFFEQKGVCAWCEMALDPNDYHVDHWKPLSKGGSNDKDNLKLLHPRCNLSKGAKLPELIIKRSS